MSSSRLGWLVLLAFAAAVSLHLAVRSRSCLALRPAAAACNLFVLLDAGRWWWAPEVARGEVAWWWLDVCVLAVMPSAWGALLARRRFASPLFTIGYAAALLALRHATVVREHWMVLLQVPRLVVGAWALWVVVWWRLYGHGCTGAANPECSALRSPAAGARVDPARPVSHVGARLQPVAYGAEGGWLGGDAEGAGQPSVLVGVVMGLGGAACVVGGLWAAWWQVQVLAAVAWLVTAAVTLRVRYDDPCASR